MTQHNPISILNPKTPFIARTVTTLQLIKKETNQKIVESLSGVNPIKQLKQLIDFLLPSTSFLMLALAGCLLYWLASTLSARFKKSASLLPSGRNLQKMILSFFFALFLFLIHQFFEGSLNTDNVVISTVNLLYSKDQIRKTKKEFCSWTSNSKSSSTDASSNSKDLA